MESEVWQCLLSLLAALRFVGGLCPPLERRLIRSVAHCTASSPPEAVVYMGKRISPSPFGRVDILA